MSYCVNSNCYKPENPYGTNYCQTCGSKLLLKDCYRAIKLIGSGGFGKTFLALDERSGDNCVIKQLLQHHQGNEKIKELFELEAKQLKKLGDIHSQIPTLFDYLEQGLEKVNQPASKTEQKYLYLILELIEGQTLLQELEQGGTFSSRQIIEFLQEFLPILKFVHDCDVIHRDIKPENIMRRNSDNKLVLIDFGAVKESTLTKAGKTGTEICTIGYASSEQLRGKVYRASDLYSLGATCVHLLTGIHPLELYDDDNCLRWQKHLKKPINKHLQQVLDKLLKQAAKERYQSVDEVLPEVLPKAELSLYSIELTATKIGEKLTQNINITNPIPETLLQGSWHIVPHHSDLKFTPNKNVWISFTSTKFAGNSLNNKIIVDTSKLMADKVYQRQISLQTNSYKENEILNLKVKTAPLPYKITKIPIFIITAIIIASFFSIIGSYIIVEYLPVAFNWLSPLFKGLIYFITYEGNSAGFQSANNVAKLIWILLSPFICLIYAVFLLFGLFMSIPFAAIAAILYSVGLLGGINITNEFNGLINYCKIIILFLIKGCVGIFIEISFISIPIWFPNILQTTIDIVVNIRKNFIEIVDNISREGFTLKIAWSVTLLSSTLGLNLGLWFFIKLTNSFFLGVIIVNFVLLVFLLIYSPLNRLKAISKYRQLERKKYLIQP
ncbi:serine/threonine kinase [Calothrix sp. NIES-2100]|uniref:serine/threonine-protein kinase n=1 Tax=Calothrix sp. NIES-2100 TaxID=1954172 RepID=UPI000B62348A|nr:serine/threonine kinase [Calothrix sp. NIES-2100]